MKTFIKNASIFGTALTILFLGSCSDGNWNALNENPNSPAKVPASSVLGSGIVDYTWNVYGGRDARMFVGTGHTADLRGNQMSSNASFAGLWNNCYDAMNQFTEAIRLARDEENENIQAAAMIMRASAAQYTSDTWGDIPYSEAFRLEERIDNPVFDSQQDLYKQLLDELDTAHGMLSADGRDLGDGDFLFNGDIDKWKKLANSLRMRIAIRISFVDPNAAAQVINQILGEPGTYPLMVNNEDNAYFWWVGADDLEPWASRRNKSFAPERMNYEIMSRMKDLNDPRMFVYAEPSDNGTFQGYKFGPDERTDPMNSAANISRFSDRYSWDVNGFSKLMVASQVWFIKAEAYERGLASGNARQAYETGIRMSLAENDVSEADIEAYLEEPGVAWDSGTQSNLDKIWLQNWIALFKQPFEAWAEVRRTDVPVLDNIPWNYAELGYVRLPIRLPYPDNERALNSNFPSNIVEQDLYYGTQVWWDTRDIQFNQ